MESECPSSFILESLPAELKGSLPSIEEIEQELEDKAL